MMRGPARCHGITGTRRLQLKCVALDRLGIFARAVFKQRHIHHSLARRILHLDRDLLAIDRQRVFLQPHVVARRTLFALADTNGPVTRSIEIVRQLPFDAPCPVGIRRSDHPAHGCEYTRQTIIGRGAFETFGIFFRDKAGGQFARAEARMLHDRAEEIDIVAQAFDPERV